MKIFVLLLAPFILLTPLSAQTSETSPPPAQLEALSKKIDEVNLKLDALSQQLLKMEQQMVRPGVVIGEATPSLAEPVHPAASVASTPGGNSHVVTKGETLTAIAKQYKVTVEDLQKFNHIEDGRKLQAGQTILIPTPSSSAAPSATPSP